MEKLSKNAALIHAGQTSSEAFATILSHHLDFLDMWEESALNEFERGKKEVFEFINNKGETYLRFMRPLTTKKQCLKCHGFQGYKVGDVRGGIVISVPLKPYLAIERKTINIVALTHGIFWLLGVLVIGLVSYRSRKRIMERRMAEEQLEHHAYYDRLTDLPNRTLFTKHLEYEMKMEKEQIFRASFSHHTSDTGSKFMNIFI